MVNGRRKYLTLFLLVVSASTAMLSFCGNNPNHRTHAAGVLTMQECLQCHSGSVSKAVPVCLGDDCLYKNNHSLMRLYPPAGKSGDYATPDAIEQAGCELENGKITCLSCHDLTNPPPHLIREGDDLCSICHLYYATGKPL